MKKLNKKGFTLIELLAVIVILAILVAVAIPAVTRYLNQARRGAFSSDASTMIEAARNDYLMGTSGKSGNNVVYTANEINAFLEKKLGKSPYGSDYKLAESFVRIVTALPSGETDPTKAVTTYYVCLTDGTQGVYRAEPNVKDSNVLTTVTSCSSTATLPTE